jgi:hypothetical protein
VRPSSKSLYPNHSVDLLNAFDEYDSPRSDTRLGFHLVLPSLESISLIWTSVEHSIALQSGYQIDIKSRNNAISVLLLLIEVLGRTDSSSLLVYDFARRVTDYASSVGKRDQTVGPKVLAGLIKFCLSETSLTLSQPRLSAVEDLLRRLICLMAPDPDEDSQLAISLCLLRIVQRRRQKTFKSLCPGLRRTLLGVGEPAIDFSAYNADFQVRACI